MATLTVWKFSSATGAEETLEKLAQLQKEHIIEIKDAAIVTWPAGKKKPQTKQAINLVGLGALDGAFWGLLFGFIFFMPLVGMALGASVGALSGSLRDYGINDDFINDVKSKVTEGTSALFLFTGDVSFDKVEAALGDVSAELIQSNLSNEQEAILREHFSPEV
uniref:Membrane protein of uknown function UCP014873 n=1 Tax=Cyanothece sp. (strain PCC 7425 / ATCC 29141) TaxID=395961 RepID=B8HPG2_CYAP4